VQVPLWAAVALAAKAKAHILAPPWLEAEALDEALSLERSSPNSFQPIPFHYLELSAALFKHAPDAFGDSTARVMDLVESIRRRVAQSL
jgi:GINS complex subunit 2